MNAARAKLATWGTAGILGVGLSLYVGWFISRLQEIQASVTPERMREVLDDVEEIVKTQEDIVPYERVVQGMIELDWTGKPKVKEVAAQPDPTPPKPLATKVQDLVTIMWVAYDAEEPAASRCVLKYKDKANVPAPPSPTGVMAGWQKNVGDTLDAGHSHIKIAAILPEGVEFGFDDETREHELVAPAERDLYGILKLDSESELIVRKDEILVPRARSSGAPAAKTTLLRENVWQIGFEDAQYINENFSEILSRDVRVAPHTDPRTGRRDGIQVMDVNPGSVVSAHGVQTGDVVKSINGHTVTSTQEAISYVKNNQGTTTKWEVVVESKGQLKTMVYYSPEE